MSGGQAHYTFQYLDGLHLPYIGTLATYFFQELGILLGD